MTDTTKPMIDISQTLDSVGLLIRHLKVARAAYTKIGNLDEHPVISRMLTDVDLQIVAYQQVYDSLCKAALATATEGKPI